MFKVEIVLAALAIMERTTEMPILLFFFCFINKVNMCISLKKTTKNVQKRTVIAETVQSFLERRASPIQVCLKPNYLFTGACSANVFVSHVHNSLRDLAAPYSDCVKKRAATHL